MGSKAEKKIVIVGKYCSGKTSLVNRFTKNNFNKLSPYQPTIGAAFVSKEVNVGKKFVTLGIWDTAGSERFESMSILYYRGAKAAIVCYALLDRKCEKTVAVKKAMKRMGNRSDMTEYSSFDKAKFYVNELKENSPDCRLYLCGTKCDLINSGERPREVAWSEVMEYGRVTKAGIVIETSSKTGQNVVELFTKIAGDLMEIPTANLEESKHKIGLEGPSQNLRTVQCGCKS